MKGDLGDITIFFVPYGAGRPIVVLLGPPIDHESRYGLWNTFYEAGRLATRDPVLEAVPAFIDTVISGQRFVLAGLSYGGYLSRGVVSHRAAWIDGVLFCVPQVKAAPALAHLKPRTMLVEA